MGKTVLVTGGAGFVGSHLCERLAKDGFRVISLDNYFAGSRNNHVEGVEYREGHTKNIEKLVPENLDVIYHLGEYARVEQSVLEPDIVHDLNVEGTAGVINLWRKTKCKLIYAGSSTKFGDGGKTRHTSPYASTKAENSEKIHAIGESEQLPYAITYFYNVYGERERTGVYGTVIEHFKRMYLSGAPCAIVSPGTQKRNFTHVLDIVDALCLVGEKGTGEFGLGHAKAYSIFEVAEFFGFGSNIVMFPERVGNRMTSDLDTTNIFKLGWEAKRSLQTYIEEFTSAHKRGADREKNILVFSTTIHPIAGLAEEAFVELAHELPSVSFDLITTKFIKGSKNIENPASNISTYRVGIGLTLDKYILPIFGAYKSLSLRGKDYLFSWALMASYGGLAGLLCKNFMKTPLLITLADQNLDDLSPTKLWLFSHLLSSADQVYGSNQSQEHEATKKSKQKLPRNTLGEGDAFANALRFAYADIVRKKMN